MSGYLEVAPGPLGAGLVGAGTLFRGVWHTLVGQADAVNVVVRPRRQRGWGSLDARLSFELPWTKLGWLAGLGKADRERLLDLSALTLEVFYVVNTPLAQAILSALPEAERQRRDDLSDLPLAETEGKILEELLSACTDRHSLLLGTADEGNLLYLFGDPAVLVTVR